MADQMDGYLKKEKKTVELMIDEFLTSYAFGV